MAVSKIVRALQPDRKPRMIGGELRYTLSTNGKKLKKPVSVARSDAQASRRRAEQFSVKVLQKAERSRQAALKKTAPQPLTSSGQRKLETVKKKAKATGKANATGQAAAKKQAKTLKKKSPAKGKPKVASTKAAPLKKAKTSRTTGATAKKLNQHDAPTKAVVDPLRTKAKTVEQSMDRIDYLKTDLKFYKRRLREVQNPGLIRQLESTRDKIQTAIKIEQRNLKKLRKEL